MSLSKQCYFNKVAGEYWIDEYGSVMYADGDVGDMNHAVYVIERCRREIAGDKYDFGDFVDWDKFKIDVANNFINKLKNDAKRFHDFCNKIGVSPQSISGDDILETDAIDIDEIIIANGANSKILSLAEGRGDPRLHAISKWNWKRIMGNNIETFTLTPTDIKAIVSGLDDISQDFDDNNSLWNIEVISPRAYYINIPLSVIKKGIGAIEFASRMKRALSWYKKAQRLDWNSEPDSNEDYHEIDGEVFWGLKGSGILWIRNTIDGSKEMLLTLRSASVTQPNTWGIPGGAASGSDLFQSALRETIEEVGSIPSGYKRINQYPFRRGDFEFITFVCVTDDARWNPRRANWETVKVQWFPLDNASLPPNLHPGVSQMFVAIGHNIFQI